MMSIYCFERRTQSAIGQFHASKLRRNIYRPDLRCGESECRLCERCAPDGLFIYVEHYDAMGARGEASERAIDKRVSDGRCLVLDPPASCSGTRMSLDLYLLISAAMHDFAS